MDLTNPLNDELEKLVRELAPEIERLNHEYNKFFTGAEKKPPIPLREKVDKMADRIRSLQRQCQMHALSFKAQGVLSKHTTYRALWDKKLAEREAAR